MLDRLQVVLNAVRFDPNSKPAIRVNFLFALKAHALLTGDKEFEDACTAEIDRIHQEQPAYREAETVKPATAPKTSGGPIDDSP